MTEQPIAERLFPGLRGCFGCDPDHPHGLHLTGRAEDGAIVAEWAPGEHHEGWPGLVHGGLLATVLDELTGWAAKLAFVERDGEDERPVVTAEAKIRYRAPAFSGRRVRGVARVVEHAEERALVEGRLESEGRTLVTCRTLYVRLRERPDWAG